MSIYRDQIKEMLQEQRLLAESCNKELSGAVDGHLVRSTSHDKRYYYQVLGKGDAYEKRSLCNEPETVKKLARKELLVKSVEALDCNIKLLEKAYKFYRDEQFDSLKCKMNPAYKDLPEEYFLKSDKGDDFIYRQSDNHCLIRHRKWAEEPYEKSTYNPEGLRHPTSAGINVRSKSEQHIVEQLVNYGVPFRYEQVLRFDSVILSADFTFEDYRCDAFYWEHAGMMDLDHYRNRHARKMKIYEANGIVPWRNLIVTYDSDGSVNVPLIKSIIEDEVIPRL